MSYYILPKTNNSITIKPNITNNTINPYVSQSLFFYYNETIKLKEDFLYKTLYLNQIIKLPSKYKNVSSIYT